MDNRVVEKIEVNKPSKKVKKGKKHAKMLGKPSIPGQME